MTEIKKSTPMLGNSKYKYVTGMRTTIADERWGSADDIVKHVADTKTGYEVIDAGCVPYMDFDFKYDDEKSRQANEITDINGAIEAVKKEYPQGRILSMVANGYSAVKKKYVNSAHVIVRGVGYFNSGDDLLKSFSSELKACIDVSVYKRSGKRQLFRLVGCSKEGEDRPFIYVAEGKVYRDVNQIPLSFESLLAQNTKDETLQHRPALVNEFVPRPDIDPIQPQAAARVEAKKTDDIGITEMKLRELISLIVPHNGQNWSWDEWKDRMWAIRNVADEFGCDLFDLAITVSNLRINKETDDATTKKIYNTKDEKPNDKRSGFRLGSLCKWAKETHPAEYVSWRVKYCNQTYYFSDIAKIISAKPINRYDLTECLKQTCLMCENNGKNIFYTKNLSSEGVVVYTSLDRLTPLANNADYFFEIPGADGKPIKTSVNGIYSQQVRYQNIYKFSEFRPYLSSDTEKRERGMLNTFGGWRWKYTKREYKRDDLGHPIPPDCIKPWVDHLKNKICKEDDLIKGVNGYHHLGHALLQWHAHLFQRPTQKPWALVMKSIEGGGKGVWKEFMEYVIGPNYCITHSSWAKICGQFNGQMDGKLFQCLNEATNFPTNQQKELMKAMIKDIDMSINRKFMAEYNVKSYARTNISTNNRRPIAIDYDDRRYCCVDAVDDHIHDTDYFRVLHESKLDENVQHEMFDYLCNYPLDGFNAEKPPMTVWKQELIGDNMGNEMVFMKRVAEGEIYDVKFEEDELRISNTDLYDAYKCWVEVSGEKKASSSREFTAELQRNGFKKKTVRLADGRKNGYVISLNALNNQIKKISCG